MSYEHIHPFFHLYSNIYLDNETKLEYRMAITSYRKGSGKFTTRKDLMEFPFYSVVENTCIYYTSNIPPILLY